MAGFSPHKATAPITGINVTPLVDITLVLLIIFMVTAKLVVSRALPMDLPSAASGGALQSIFSVSLSRDGSTQVDGAPAPDDAALLRLARSARANDPELRALLQADGDVPHRRVIAALDVLRQAGVSRVAFGVMPAAPIDSAGAATP
jgi:biopolymer transport protein ExbD